MEFDMFMVLALIGAAACGSVSKNATADGGAYAPRADAPRVDSMPPDGPASSATALAAESISSFTAPNRVFTKVPFNGVQYDDASEFDVGTSTFTPKHAGD